MKEKMPVFELFIDFNFSISSGLKSYSVEKFSHFGLWSSCLPETSDGIDY